MKLTPPYDRRLDSGCAHARTDSFFRARLLLLMATLFFLSSCAFAPAEPTPSQTLPPGGSCTLDLPNGVADEKAIQAVLAAESQLMVAQDIEALMALWSESSSVADAKNTSDETNDDQRWIDKDAIRHRYVRTVFPGAPSEARPADLQIAINGDHAVVLATTNIDAETALAGDRWELDKIDGCWQISSLTYNLESID